MGTAVTLDTVVLSFATATQPAAAVWTFLAVSQLTIACTLLTHLALLAWQENLIQ
jgi:hypothetical protein